MIKRYAAAVGLSFGAALIAIILFSALSLRLADPRKLTDVFGIMAFMTGCIAAGFAFKITDDNPVASGALCSLIYVFLIMTISLFFRDENTRPFLQSAIVYAAGIAVSAIIGLLFTVKRPGSKKARKNMMKRMNKR